MKILITGGAGFIGSRLAIESLKRGYEVIVYDNLSTGNTNNISSCLANENFSLVQGNVLEDKDGLEDLIKNVDVVAHMAATVGVKNIIDCPHDLIMNNINSTYKILNLCDIYNKKVFIASSSEVYGKLNKVPFREDDDCLYGNSNNLRWSYGASKLTNEMLALSFYKNKGLEVYIGRFFNIIGAGQNGDSGMVVPRFINWAKQNHPIKIHGDGKQVRTFTYVEEACKSVIDLINSEKGIGQIINIAGKATISIEDLALTIKRITNSESEIQYDTVEYERDFEDIPIRIPSVEKLHSVIGWTPEMCIEDIIKTIIFKQH
ncbi:GDP-mannose 4,6-dehydratase [Bacillus toyonensis]|uniref:NAD-dependent epimerase/dehydratase family protein n=1 Tax=Bacillus toyonensis TaxID=155322 RepID=UPI0018D06AC1|nr:GDP-mannose 4,6-dehydratase [Bacillus toyonensis]